MHILFTKGGLFYFLFNQCTQCTHLSEIHNIKYYLQTESLVYADLYPYVDRLYKMYIARNMSSSIFPLYPV